MPNGFFSLSCSGSIVCVRYFQYSDWIFFWVALRNFPNDVGSVSLWNFLALLYSRFFLFMLFYVFSNSGEWVPLERIFEGDELVHNFLEAMFEEVPKWFWGVSDRVGLDIEFCFLGPGVVEQCVPILPCGIWKCCSKGGIFLGRFV